MANQAIHQRPFTANREDDDVIMIDRGTSTYKLKGMNMAPAILSAQVLIPSASVLTLNDTPVLVVPSPSADKVIVPMRGLIEFSAGTVYDTNVGLVVGGTGSVDDTIFALAGFIDGTVNQLTAPGATILTALEKGEGLSAFAPYGNPANGTQDITVTVWYYLFTP